MYEKHWDLGSKPFENNWDTSFFFPSDDHREALVRLLYAVNEGKGSVVVCGDPGCGKTFLLHALAHELRSLGVKVAFVVNPASDPTDLLRQVARAFGVRNVDTGPSELLGAVEQFLSYHQRRGERSVLLIDDADHIGEVAGYNQLRLLSNLQDQGETLLSVILAGQPRLPKLLKLVPGLVQRVAFSASLSALARDETPGYVQHRISKAQGRNGLFDRRALQEIYQCTGGVPRLINHVCDLSLLIGASEGRSVIDASVVGRARTEVPDLRSS